MRKKVDLSDFESDKVVGPGQAALNISETPDLLIFPHKKQRKRENI